MNAKQNARTPVTRIAYAVSVALTGNYAPAVLAQQSQATDLEAVIVTARKREETLLDIPQEIQAISQEQLERANLDGVGDFSRFVPSLSYSATTPGRGSIYFRGVADDSASFIADASAAVYLDEQPLTQSALQPEIRVVDIERIEALPGPQGTLYGSSSQSGTLRYITNKPDPSGFYSDVSLDGHSVEDGDEGYEISGVLNLPVGENVAIRVVGFSARDAGFIDNVFAESQGGTFDNADFVAKDVNDIDYAGGRAALRWLPNENWTVDASVVYQQMDASTYAEDNVNRAGRELANVRFVDEDRSDEWTQVALTLQGDLGWANFTSATSYFTRRISYFQDNTDYTFYLSGFGAFYANYDFGPDPRGLGWSDRDYADRIAQEFRLQGGTEKMTWVAGLFYENMENGFDFFTRIDDYEDTPAFAYWQAYYGVEPGTTDNSFYHSKNDQETEQIAVFGEVGYSPNEDWTLTAGLRWFDHTRKRDYFTQQPNGRDSSGIFEEGETTTSDITKKLSVQYNINEDAMVYALFSDGFRAGGRNVTRPGVILPLDYEPDFLDNYELGFKSRWAGGRYAFNITAFKMEWKDYQVEVVDPGEDALYAVMVYNVGDAEIEGVSLDFSARLWESLEVGLNLQLLDPKVTEGNELVGTEDGDRLPFSADEKGAAWLEYTLPREIAGGQLYGRLQWTYTGNSLNGISDPLLQPAYQITDAKIGFDADDWEIYAYVDNLTNERAQLFISTVPPLGTVTVNTPRTWGIGFSKSWGGGN
ncbi:MAG TPA: TonB-dependent receptor [Steroidobacteraceae bacterium]|nr:TonB-dependent receptor [Steroidobacteraceae bacterium]